MANYKINNNNLPQLSKHITVPQYDRLAVKTGIVHVGIGGFHRSHEAYYTDQLLHDDSNNNWGICGVALLEWDEKIFDVLKEQDGLYTLIVKELDGSLTTSIIGAITSYLFAPENPDAVIEKMADPDVKIITLTITEGGYNYNEAIGAFDFENPSIQFDLANPETPKTIFGYLTQAFKRRKERGLLGCTVQSCDNIQGNGHLAKEMLLSYVAKAAPSLVSWIKENVSFPNSMVDRITPVTLPKDIETLKDTTGIEDAWPVVCEPFKQWVIEDDFIAGRPNWETVGAQFVKDVAPYERMKLSLLNAGHSVLGILGALLGYSTIDEVVYNSTINTFLKLFMDKEVTPTLKDLQGVNLEEYKKSLIERFGNIYMKDQIDRICSESAAKFPVFILPTIREQLKQQGSIELTAFVVAAWAIYSLGKDEKGKELVIKDVLKSTLTEKAIIAKENPASFLEISSVFGDLKDSKIFEIAFTKAYQDIKEYGVTPCVERLNDKNSMKNIVCFGEVLWDVFPNHKKIGGAPLNVALRLKSLNNNVAIITRIGEDAEGEEITKLITDFDINTESIQVDKKLKTGEVTVSLNEKGSATYDINSPRAWDAIELNKSAKELTKNADAFIFGSLIARSQSSRETLYELLKQASYKVFDVNLREPFYNNEVLISLMNKADFIKFNDDEIFEIAGALHSNMQSLEQNMKFIAKETNTKSICVTKGRHGAILYYNDAFYYNGGYEIIVEDTVGAGDSFLASLIDKLLKGISPQKSINFATAVGAVVASRKGANPIINKKEIEELMKA